MGASQRKEAVTYFTHVALDDAPPTRDDFLARLATYHKGICSGCELVGLASPIVARLLQQGEARAQARLHWLLQLCAEMLEGAVAGGAAQVSLELLTLLHLVELVMRTVLAAVQGNSLALLQLIEGGNTGSTAAAAAASTSGDKSTNEGDVGRLLCHRLLAYSVGVELSRETVMAHAEVVRLVLSLTSSALHHGTNFVEDHVDVFTEMIMSSSLLERFLLVLMHRTAQWGTTAPVPSPTYYAEGYQPSLRNLFHLLGTGGGAFQTVKEETRAAGQTGEATAPRTQPTDAADLESVAVSCSAAEQVSRHSAALLAVLVAHQKGNGRNPALDYVKEMQDKQPIPFQPLLESITARLSSCPTLCMLLYVLLHDHPTFLHDVLPRHHGTVLRTVQEVLRLCYVASSAADLPPRPAAPPAAQRTPPPSEVRARGEASLAEENAEEAAATGAASASSSSIAAKTTPGAQGEAGEMQVATVPELARCMRDQARFAYPFINFMASTLLLLLTQDRAVNKLLCDVACRPAFLAGHLASHAVTASLLVAVLSHGILRALNDRNESLAAVFVPCLANVAPFVHDLDTSAAQRLVGLVVKLTQRVRRVEEAYMTVVSRTQTAEEAEGNSAGVASAEQSRVDESGAADVPTPYRRISRSDPLLREDAATLQEMGQMYLRQLQAVVETVEVMLRGTGRNNEALIYDLLYMRDRLVLEAEDEPAAGLFLAPAREVLANVVELIRSYEAAVERATNKQNPADILAAIRQKSRAKATPEKPPGEGADGGTKDAGDETDLLYTYEELPDSYQFFGPFVWATLLTDARYPGGMLWCRNVAELRLFPDIAAS